MLITVDRVTLEALLKNAEPAAHLVGHLDDGVPDAGLDPPGDDIDVIARDGTALRHNACLVFARAAAVDPDDVFSQGGAPMLISGSGGAR